MTTHKPKGEPTDDDIARHLRPIRADYVRRVRRMAKPPSKKDGCFKQFLPILVITWAIIAVTLELIHFISRSF